MFAIAVSKKSGASYTVLARDTAAGTVAIETILFSTKGVAKITVRSVRTNEVIAEVSL